MKLLLCLPALLYAAITPLASAGSATWATNPTSNDWNTATNWMPQTVPNAQTDVATFCHSAVTQVASTSYISVDSVVFNPGADSYAINVGHSALSCYGDGVVNNSGQTQQFTFTDGGMTFHTGSAGDNTSYVLSNYSAVAFADGATAGSANFTVQDVAPLSSTVSISGSSETGISTGGDATFTLLPRGLVLVDGGGTAGNATFHVAGGVLNVGPDGDGGQSMIDCSEGGSVAFGFYGTVGKPQVTAHGATGRKSSPGIVNLLSSDASQGTFVIEGGTGQQSAGGRMEVAYIGTLSEGSVTLTGGQSGGFGGSLVLRGASDGGSASIIMSGNAVLDFSLHDQGSIKVGSIDGAGTMILGAIPLSIGTNNLDTTFSGVIEDGDARTGFGPLLKVGTGTLTLGGANTYAGGTTVTAGVLTTANTIGSATGTGSVNVNGGSLGGKGMISGPVTIGTGGGSGAILAPSVGSKQPLTLSLSNTLTCKADSIYTCQLSTSKKTADEVIAKGVTLASGAQFALQAVGNKRLPSGTAFTILSNTSATPISGTFANLPNGSTLTAGRNKLLVNYTGGDGNDLTLTAQ